MKQMTGLGWIIGLGLLAGCDSTNARLEVSKGENSDDGGSQSTGQDAESPGAAEAGTGAAEAGTGTDGASSDATGDTSTATLGDASNFGTGFMFQPSNIPLSVIAQYAAMAQDETITSGNCRILSSATGQASPFGSPIEAVTQTDPVTLSTSTVNLIVVKSLTVQSLTCVVTGSGSTSLPLVIVSLSDVTLDMGAGLLGNSTLSESAAGPGAPVGNDSMGAGSGGGAPGSTGGTGAGGGSYCGVGGTGGSGGAASTPYGSIDIRPLTGGSAGGGSNGAPGGDGGGGIQIVAQRSITIAAGCFISVSGGGGANGHVGPQGSCTWAVGGGGGSGGAILLEAPTVTVAGALVANGAQGGGATSGQDGWDALPVSTATTPAASAMTTPVGGAGGAGTTPYGGSGQNGNLECADSNGYSSGGGGGGVGRIRINTSSGTAATTGATLSPDPSPDASMACETEGTLRPLGSTP
jgi:hypothetical protein